MFRLLIQWLLSAIALMIVSRVVPGFYVESLGPAMIAAVVIGFLNATSGFRAQGDHVSPRHRHLRPVSLGDQRRDDHGGFAARDRIRCEGWTPAFWGAVVLSLLSMLFGRSRRTRKSTSADLFPVEAESTS